MLRHRLLTIARRSLSSKPPASDAATAVLPTAQAASLPAIPNASLVSGAPISLTQSRRVYIYQPSRSATQAGVESTQHWALQFDMEPDPAARWTNPLMGWTSSADSVQALRFRFRAKEEAMEFAERQGWQWHLQEPFEKQDVKKEYAENFAYSAKKLKLIRTK